MSATSQPPCNVGFHLGELLLALSHFELHERRRRFAFYLCASLRLCAKFLLRYRRAVRNFLGGVWGVVALLQKCDSSVNLEGFLRVLAWHGTAFCAPT